jgi:ABC-type sugar transport system ATPase subunit
MEQYALEMLNISKRFPGVQALSKVNLCAKKGQVHALVGENGAGKSTLMKVLAGVHKPDEGEIRIDGNKTIFNNPQDALTKGIAVIYQELNLVPRLTAIENVMLGHELSRGGWLDKKGEEAEARKWLDYVSRGNLPDYKQPVCMYSIAQQQMVEIAKALSLKARIIVMDEPTASLTDKEMEILFEIIRKLKEDGVTVIYISHRLDEIFAICDHVTVLRDGAFVDSRTVCEVDKAWLIHRMIGREMSNGFPPHVCYAQGELALQVKNLCGNGFKDISFDLRKGEILGFFGLVGSGRTEVMRAVFGADIAASGEIYMNGKKVMHKHPCNAVNEGIGFATEDRKQQGLFLNLDVENNVSIVSLKRLASRGFVKQRKVSDLAQRYIHELQIAVSSEKMLCKNLSGGNQQKVVLAKWLGRGCSVLILDEPTRGIDVGAKYEIYTLMNKLAQEGVSIIMISSELPEVLAMSSRIIVMHEGRVAGEIDHCDADETVVMMHATNTASELAQAACR